MATRINDTATKIQIQNLRAEVTVLKDIVSDLLLAMKDSHPNLLLKYSRIVEDKLNER